MRADEVGEILEGTVVRRKATSGLLRFSRAHLPLRISGHPPSPSLCVSLITIHERGAGEQRSGGGR